MQGGPADARLGQRAGCGVTRQQIHDGLAWVDASITKGWSAFVGTSALGGAHVDIHTLLSRFLVGCRALRGGFWCRALS